MNKALILVDFQNEWANKESDYYVGDIAGLLSRSNELIDYCRENNFKIIFTRHIEKDSQDAFAPDSWNSEIISEMHRKESDVVVAKNKISSFYKTNLEDELKGVEEIVVAGILSNLCVRSLIHDAYDRDFGIVVIKNCCASFSQGIQDFTFEDLKATREEIEFVDLDDFIK